MLSIYVFFRPYQALGVTPPVTEMSARKRNKNFMRSRARQELRVTAHHHLWAEFLDNVRPLTLHNRLGLYGLLRDSLFCKIFSLHAVLIKNCCVYLRNVLHLLTWFGPVISICIYFWAGVVNCRASYYLYAYYVKLVLNSVRSLKIKVTCSNTIWSLPYAKWCVPRITCHPISTQLHFIAVTVTGRESLQVGFLWGANIIYI
jgi:hypothetical protein